MDFRLRYAPTIYNAGRFAKLTVESVKDISKVHLDYSPLSLHLLDRVIAGLRRDGVRSDAVAETLFTFGCYVGEVFVRNATGQWRDPEELGVAEYFNFPMVISLPDKQVCNPIGKCFKRLDNGEEDFLPYFYQVFTGQAVPEPLTADKKRWWKRR
jgi:hypothetical protein